MADDPFATPLGTRVKFTSAGVAVTVNEEDMPAAMGTGPAGNLICPDAAAAAVAPRYSNRAARAFAGVAPALLLHNPNLWRCSLIGPSPSRGCGIRFTGPGWELPGGT